jgi:hypothetical protein
MIPNHPDRMMFFSFPSILNSFPLEHNEMTKERLTVENTLMCSNLQLETSIILLRIFSLL